MEECATPGIDRRITLSVEGAKSTVDDTPCRKSNEQSDGSETLMLNYSPFDISSIGVATLCSVDKMRIDHLFSELNKCVEAKKEIELLLKVSKSENEDMVKTFESCDGCKHENERRNLEFELLTESTELDEFMTNTSYTLKILADQISAWELETTLITDTVNELFAQKIHLEKEITRMTLKTILLTGKESRMWDRVAIEKLYSKKHELKADVTLALTFDRGCQTEEMALP